ncbi:RNA polymerase sigma factor, partial [Singulisphaera rosea]
MSRHSGELARDLDTLIRLGTSVGLTDAQLLERFVLRESEASELAFEALVQRHGPMVWQVCREALGHAT